MVELLQVVAEVIVIVLVAVQPLLQKIHGYVNIASQGVNVMTPEEEAIEHRSLPAGGQRIREIPVGSDEWKGRNGFSSLHRGYETTSINAGAVVFQQDSPLDAAEWTRGAIYIMISTRSVQAMRAMMILLAGAGLLAAETWTGTVVDVMCKGKDLASHTRECALQCAKGGYGLVLGDGTFVKFNEAGNARTLAALKKLERDKDLKAKVTGTRKGEVIQVGSIEFN